MTGQPLQAARGSASGSCRLPPSAVHRALEGEVAFDERVELVDLLARRSHISKTPTSSK